MPRNDLTERARTLRHESTQAERRLWNALRDRRLGGWKWKRQVPRGPYGLTGVCDAILAACGGEAPHPSSPRKRGEG